MKRPSAHHLRHGTQLAAAVAIAYGLSAAAGLPEGFWAVMSALIVTRPDTGATLGAGWDRVRGTLLGTACGLAGVAARDAGLGSAPATLAIVAALAFASADVPILRSAPITALIILSSGGIAGHTAWQVAYLRVAEIAIGVGVGLLVSVAVPAARAGRRFEGECAALLRRIAADVEAALGDIPRPAEAQEMARTAMRAALRELSLLADSAGREAWWSRRFGKAPAAAESTPTGALPPRIARLLMRTSQDAGLFARVFGASNADDPWRVPARVAVCRALVSTAAVFDQGATRPDLEGLRALQQALVAARGAGPGAEGTPLWLAGPLNWLADDLRSLARAAAGLRKTD